MIKTKHFIYTIFFLLSLASIFTHILRFEGIISLSYIFVALIVNSLFCLFFIEIYKILDSHNFKKSAFFVTYLALAFVSIVYIGGIGSYLGTKYFWSFSGIVFFWEAMNILVKILLIMTAALLLGFGFLITIKDKTPEGKFRVRKIIIISFSIVLILTILPSVALLNSSPLTDLFYPIFEGKDYLDYLILPEDLINSTNQKCTLIFDNSLSSIKKPNVIFILLEAVSSDHIGYTNYSREVTPNIDLLANKSFIFTNTYSSASHSDLAQPALLSSRYSLFNEIKKFPLYLGYPAFFIWDGFKINGYKTAYFSSQNDEWMGMLDYYNITNLDKYSYSLSDGIYDYGSGKELKDYDETTIGNAISWLNNTINESFFLLLELQATHYPYSYPENNSFFTPDEPSALTNVLRISPTDFQATLNRYDNALRYVDKQIGDVLSFLKNNNLSEDTIIILTSDHGEDLNGSHRYYRHGPGIYNPEIKVPLFIYLPKEKPIEINSNVNHLDLVPTLFSILNFSIPDQFQGSPFCKEDKPKYFLTQNAAEQIGLVFGEIKYIINLQSYQIEAYNLTSDPGELNNLILSSDGEIYKKTYNPLLLNWFNCQINYYKNKDWSSKIDCR